MFFSPKPGPDLHSYILYFGLYFLQINTSLTVLKSVSKAMSINYQINELGSFHASIVQVNDVRAFNVLPQERALALCIEFNLRSGK